MLLTCFSLRKIRVCGFNFDAPVASNYVNILRYLCCFLLTFQAFLFDNIKHKIKNFFFYLIKVHSRLTNVYLFSRYLIFFCQNFSNINISNRESTSNIKLVINVVILQEIDNLIASIQHNSF